MIFEYQANRTLGSFKKAPNNSHDTKSVGRRNLIRKTSPTA